MLFLGGVILGKKNEPIKANEIEQHIKTNFDDFYQVFLQNMISSIPAPFGPFFSAIFSTVICPAPITEKISQLLIQFGHDIEELQEKGLVDIEELMNDPIFTSELLYAIQIAMRNTQKEHLEAIRNAILNSALHNPPEEDTRKIFFNLIDSLTKRHFILLKYFTEIKKLDLVAKDLVANVKQISFGNEGPIEFKIPKDHVKIFKFNLLEVVQYAFHDSCPNIPLYEQILVDMDFKGLIKAHNFEPAFETLRFDLLTDGSTHNPLIKPFGELLVEFVTSPL